MTNSPDNGTAPVSLLIGPDQKGLRLDKALAAIAPEASGLSRSRLKALIEGGAVSGPEGKVITDIKRKVREGESWLVSPPPPVDPEPQPEDIPLNIVYEDEYLIVVDKPVGMVVHPAPGAETGTLVNALLHHCGDSLSGIGGERRPGIVHRIDKDTSGLLVVAKTDLAHQGLAKLFAAHDIERNYLAICYGLPDANDRRLLNVSGLTPEKGGWMRIETHLDRSKTDRKKMAVSGIGPESAGRNAITHFYVEEELGPRSSSSGQTMAALLRCRLETGRTHQIRVHMAHAGHSLIGDPVYGRKRTLPQRLKPQIVKNIAKYPGQALHAATLGFVHPVTNQPMLFESTLSGEFLTLLDLLRSVTDT